MSGSRIVVVGASGFVGSAVVAALEGRQVESLHAPRLATSARSEHDLLVESATLPVHAELTEALRGADVVVNAAGDPDASSLDEDRLYGANSLLPAVLLRAAREAGVRRFVHVSSAVVQNDKPVLDSTEDLRPFSPYSSSKVLGEQVLRALAAPGTDVVRYRPPSVHAPSRRVTRMIARIASSPAATVARPGDQATPQALLPNVAAAVAHLATCEETPPSVVHHPWEGMTAASLMVALSGGRAPRRVPRWLARGLVMLGKVAGRIHRPTAANARRVELLWFGQEQAPSWLSSSGWSPCVGLEGWAAMETDSDVRDE